MKPHILAFILLIASCSAATDNESAYPGVYMENPPADVTCTGMCFDKNNFIWVGTKESGLFHYDGTRFIHFIPDEKEGSLPSGHITKLLLDSRDRLWVGTERGITVYLPGTLSFLQIPIGGEDKNINTIVEDSRGNILATTGDGVYLYDENRRFFKKTIGLDSSEMVKLYIGPDNDIFIVKNWGIDRYDLGFNLLDSFSSAMAILGSWIVKPGILVIKSFPFIQMFDLQNKCFKVLPRALSGLNDPDKLAFVSSSGNNSMIFGYDDNYYHYDFSSGGLLSEKDEKFPFVTDTKAAGVQYIKKDNSGNYWLSTRTKGIVKAQSNIKTHYFPLERYASEHRIKTIVPHDGKIWMVSDYHYLVCFDPQTRKLNVQEIGTIINRTISDDRNCDIYKDTYSGRLLLTVDNNLWDCRMDRNGNLRLNTLYHMSYVSDYLKLAIDKTGTYWAGGIRGTLQYATPCGTDAYTVKFSELNLNGMSLLTGLTAITCLDDGTIAAAFSNSAIGFVNPATKDNKVVYIPKDKGIKEILSLCQDDEGRLWIGTTDGLWYMNIRSKEIERSDWPAKGKVSHIQRDDRGRMFIIVESNLLRYLPSSRTFKTILSCPGVSASALLASEGDEIFAYLGGQMHIIDKNSINSTATAVPEMTSVLISDNENHLLDVVSFDEKDCRRKITLPGSSNRIKLAIGVNELTDNRYLSCKVKFDGVFKGSRDYTGTDFIMDNIPYGSHRLTIQLVNPSDGTTSAQHSFTVKVNGPWYVSTAARITSLIIIIAVIWLILHLIQKANSAKLNTEMAVREKEAQLRMYQENIDFFTDISHEFRTPLTIISGSTTSLLQDPQLSISQSHLAHLIQRNSDRMLKLVGQLTDLNKLDHNRMELNIKICDLSGTVRGISASFEGVAERKNLDFKTISPDYLLCPVDSDKLEKMAYNLLSNAFKYTPPGGSITFTVRIGNSGDIDTLFPDCEHEAGNWLIVSISDTGIGVPDDKKDEIFTRFTRVNPDSRVGGTGIGLAFTKSLVKAHHGFIGMSDRKDESGERKGSIFYFAIPADKAAYSADELSDDKSVQAEIDSKKYISEYTMCPVIRGKSDKAVKVMVIDDDSEILYYLSLILSADYEVITCPDAVSGYKKMEKMQPDLIISDVMMVEMDGLKLCRMVKEDIALSHIPFILLTAKTTVNDQIEGMNAGADAYVTKPFNPDYLKAVINSLLRNRDNIRKTLGTSTSTEKIETDSMSQQDKMLLDKLYGIMEEKIMDSELNISELTVTLGMSRTKLYYKIKGLTGQTPNEFFKTYKLNKAAEMLKEGKYKISAISDMVGFCSPSHFAAAFQKQFGKSPSKY